MSAKKFPVAVFCMVLTGINGDFEFFVISEDPSVYIEQKRLCATNGSLNDRYSF